MASASVSWNQGDDVPTKPPAADQPSCHAIVDAWNAIAVVHGLAQIRAMPSARIAKLRGRIAEVGHDRMIEAITRVGSSDFCRGRNERGWRADFDFLLQPSSLMRVLEGRYDNPRRPGDAGPVGGGGPVRPTFRNGALEALAREHETSAMVIDGQDYQPLGISHGDD